MNSMQDRQPINDSYYCGRMRPDSIVSVLTGNSYVVAEYDERTGDIRWQRVVNASQKEGIHNWLKEHFPVKAPIVKAPVKAAVVKAIAKPVAAAKPAAVRPTEKAAPKASVKAKSKSAPPAKKVVARKRQLARA